MRNIVYKRLLAASALGAAILSGVIVSSSLAADIEPYQRIDALKTIMNPHEQISDEGEILWGTCIICHRDVPDPRKEKSIRDTKLRFEDDLKEMCYRCHQMPPHPAREGVTQTMVVFASPNHLRVPPDHIRNNIRISLKDAPVILPLEPKTGKIFCATCHNPHERGVLTDRADMGADSTRRLRTPGVDICEYCHRK